MVIQGIYNPALVVFSVLIAVFAAWTALNLVSRLQEAHPGHFTRTRVLAGGLVLGLGIWSMHFVAILAFELPVAVRFDGMLTLWSLISAILACVAGLGAIARRQDMERLVAGGVLLGAGIASMHYTGMLAMRVAAEMQYSTVLVVISVLIGVGASFVALWLPCIINRSASTDTTYVKIASAILMGLAIAGMHYTGMAAMSFHELDIQVSVPTGFELNPDVIGVTLTISSLLLMSFSLWSSRIVEEADLVRASEEKISAIAESVVDVIITVNDSGVIEFANTAVETVFGYRPDELQGENICKLIPRHWRPGLDKLQSDGGKGHLPAVEQGELQAAHKSGRIFPVDIALNETRIDDKATIVAIIRDITDRIEASQKLHFLAHHDSLTSLPNRITFQEHVDQALAHARRRNFLVAVLFLDLDRFKVINDTLGHHVGDFILQEIAERLKSCVRDGDIVARLSGDEFTVLLDDVAMVTDVEPIAQEIIKVLSEPFRYSGQELFSSASIGISLYPNDCDDSKILLQHADIAMYCAKSSGGNNYRFYTPDMNLRSDERLSLEVDLRHALERDEFLLYYQPQVNLQSGNVTGVEALIRWQHPTLGLIAPDEFIPLLEETGLIVSVGEWVLRTACQQIRDWEAEGVSGMQVAVNLSARQFSDPDLVKKVLSTLNSTNVKPGQLELEITESVLMQHTSSTIEALRQLQASGVSLAIDDFGTGYSSLSYLRRFPVNTLKIDRSFVRDVTKDPDNAALVQLIIDMAHSLKLNVVAEGIELKEQLEFLQQRNCQTMQGFLFSKPRPAEDLEGFFTQGPGLVVNS